MSGKRKSPKPKAPAKPRQERAKPTTNPNLTQQTRRILGKHYANRFGKR
jgi:hypothetical protein